MFAGYMVNAWVSASIVAVVGGAVGFFVVLRGSTFAAHAVPQAGLPGAAGASLIGVNTVFGLAVFTPLMALSIGWLGRRRRSDVVTALTLTMMLGLASLFLAWSVEYSSATYQLLFGEVLGVSTNEIWLTALFGAVALMSLAVIFRPLLTTSVVPEIAEARGLRNERVEMLFLLVVALVSAVTVPVVGALLVFSLMVGPPAAARTVVNDPRRAIVVSVLLALATVWIAIALAYLSNWPIGFFVGAAGLCWYLAARVWAHARLTRRRAHGRPHGRGAPGAIPG